MQHKLYYGCWTDDILKELRRNLTANHIMNEQQALRLQTAMANAFPEAKVGNYQRYIALMTNHPKDRHVLAATVAAQATMIVTFNLKDFPVTALASLNVTAIAPDDFLLLLHDVNPKFMPQIMREQASGLRHPPMLPLDVVSTLSTYAPQFAEQMRALLQL